ncbi:hypothetical protein JHK82_026342 [Glycine max]|nr:hypothetical protein JHK82_026342 [Glycine max]
MEDDKRKRKNKKKKNKQNKNVENGVGETANRDQNLVSNGKDEHTNLSETANEQSSNVDSNGVGETSSRDQNLVNNGKDEPALLSGVTHEQSMNADRNGVVETPNSDQNLVKSGKDKNIPPLEFADGQSTNMDSNGHLPNGKECAISEETIRKLKEENDIHIQKETLSKETIRKLKAENDMHIQKEAIMEETIRKLTEQNDLHMQKEAIFPQIASEETIRKLKEKHDVHVQKEAISEDTIRNLKEKNDMHMQKETLSQETIRKLKEENEGHIQKEAISKETIKKFEEENDKLVQKETSLEMRIAQLQSENNSLLQKEAGLVERSNQLLNEKVVLSLKAYIIDGILDLGPNPDHWAEQNKDQLLDPSPKEMESLEGLYQKAALWRVMFSYIGRRLHVGLETRFAQLHSENNSLLQKEATLVERTNQLLNEKEVLSLKGESLEQKIYLLESDLSSLVEKENSTKDTISKLNGNIAVLQVQVEELEESRNNLFLENQQLREKVSSLESTVQNHENSNASSCSRDAPEKDLASENKDLKSEIEAAFTLVEKLMAENAELVEKVICQVTELCVELDHQSAVTEPNEMTEFAKPTGVAIPPPESAEYASVSAPKLNSLEETSVKDNGNSFNDAKHVVGVMSNSSLLSDDAGEIVQIPLDDNEIQDIELQDAKNVENDADAVPITDAPLIGAPFRLISFVANFVSGADLVDPSSSNTAR